MRGYVYLDNDYNLHMRGERFIEEDDPGFWNRNSHLIDTVWKFDTNEEDSMVRLMDSIKRKELKEEPVRNLCSQIGFDLTAFILKHKTPKPSFSIPEIKPKTAL